MHLKEQPVARDLTVVLFIWRLGRLAKHPGKREDLLIRQIRPWNEKVESPTLFLTLVFAGECCAYMEKFHSRFRYAAQPGVHIQTAPKIRLYT
jgi:hypothetical protein